MVERILNKEEKRNGIINTKLDGCFSTTEFIKTEFFNICADNEDVPAKIINKYLKTLLMGAIPKGESLSLNVEKNCIKPYIKEHKK